MLKSFTMICSSPQRVVALRLRPMCVCIVALLVVSGCVASSTKVDVKASRAAAHAADVASFDQVWSEIATTFPDPAHLTGGAGKVDWVAARTELRPRIERASSRDEARQIISTLLARLNEPHFKLLAEASSEVEDAQRDGGDVGLTLRVLNGRAIVWRVAAGSPAALVGVAPGWRLETVDKGRLIDVIAQDRKLSPSPLRLQRRVQDKLAVAAGQKIVATFTDARSDERTVQLTARAAEPALGRMGDLAPMSLHIDTRSLAGGIGYFSLSSFLDPPRVMPSFNAFVRAPDHAAGLVIDLRGNAGGISGMATAMAGYFVGPGASSLGSMLSRDGTLQFTINPRLPAYAGKVALLVDGTTASTAEIFAGGLQDLGRVRIFGEPTAGAALPGSTIELANGDRFQFAVADFLLPNGQRIEGRGVMPDVVVHPTRVGLLGGHDEQLDAALRWIKSGDSAMAKPAAVHP